MEIVLRDFKTIPVLDIIGEVDLYNAKQIKDTIESLIKQEKYQVIVNLEKVPFMDSSGIGTLVTGMYRLKKYHGGMKVINIVGSVAKVFKLTGMEDHLEVCKDEEDAVNYFDLD
ncbi:MAG: STAS domain-containing protein [Leptospira sp.]|nr:STAS domain-containing protein [Leptospira sp.]